MMRLISATFALALLALPAFGQMRVSTPPFNGGTITQSLTISGANLNVGGSTTVTDCVSHLPIPANHVYLVSGTGCMTDGGVIFTTAGGDLTGTYPNPTLAQIQGQTITGTTGTGNVVLSASPTVQSLTDTGSTALTSLTVTPTAAATVSTDQSQASGGSTLLPFASTSGISVGQIVKGTSIPLGTQVSSIVSTAQATRAANGSFSSGQKVIPMSVTTAFAVGQQCTDTTSPTSIGAGNVIASIQAATSITLTSNVAVNSSGAADSITCDPVVTLTKTSTATISSGASINFYAAQTTVSTASAIFSNAGASLAGNLNVGGVSFLGQAISGSASAPGVALFSSNQGFFQSGGTLGLASSGQNGLAILFGASNNLLVVGPTLNSRTVTNGGGAPLIEAINNGSSSAINGIADFSYRASATVPAALYLEHSNSSTLGTQTAVASGDHLGMVDIQGSDGTNFQESSVIRGEVDAAVSGGIVPGRVVILTTNGSGVLTEAVRIDSSQRTTHSGAVRLVQKTVAGLPACAAGTTGDMYQVTDASAPSLGGTLSGSGSVWVIGVCNGTNWVAD